MTVFLAAEPNHRVALQKLWTETGDRPINSMLILLTLVLRSTHPGGPIGDSYVAAQQPHFKSAATQQQ